MRWIALALIVGCGGGLGASDCDPCLGAQRASNTEADGANVACTCALGGGRQTYARVLETTTFCADNRAAWADYATAHCR